MTTTYSSRDPAFSHVPRLGAGLFLSLILLGPGAGSGLAQPPAVVGHWEGTLRYRGAEMPIRLHLEPSGDSLVATLDIPSLVMAWEPIPTTATRDGVSVELPFGLGAMPVEPNGDLVHAEKQLGGETLTLHLQRAKSPPFTREDVVFQSGGVSLAGTLVVPNEGRPHAAVVLIHESGRQGRGNWSYRSWADLLVRQGLAVLFYDKRGVGTSGGEYGAGLAQLTEDVVAASEFLTTRPEIDPSRIGLMGSSQGAWVAEAAAAERGNLSFLLLVSAAAGTPKDQELRKIEYGMRSDGRSEGQIEDALAYMGLYFYVTRTAKGWPLLQAAIERAQAEEWGQYVDQPRSEGDLSWWRENHAFQPSEAVKDLDLPVLLLYGGADWITPHIEHADKLRSLFPVAERVDVHVFPGADHRLEVGAGRDAAGKWHWPSIAPGMREAVSDWLQRNGVGGSERSEE